MDLGLFLPKVYHFVRQDYVINGNHFNQFISDYNANNPKDILTLVIGLALFILSIVLAIVYAAYSKNDGRTSKRKTKENCIIAIPFVALLIAFFGACFMLVGFLGVNKQSEKDSTSDFGNGFQVKQTSFIIQPNESSFQSSVADYVLDGKQGNIPTSSKNYAIYARIYNNSSHSYYNYLIGNMVNGYFETITTTQKKDYQSDDEKHNRLIKDEQLKALDTYIEFIKKHHLEDNFKDNSKLIINYKFYDKNYKPQLVMKGKDGRILYTRHNISKKDIANVGITK